MSMSGAVRDLAVKSCREMNRRCWRSEISSATRRLLLVGLRPIC